MIDFSEIYDAVRFRWKIVLGITLLLVIGILLWSLIASKTYTATASLVFDSQAPQPTSTTQLAEDPSLISTQTDVIQSNSVAREVIKDTKLDQNQDVIDLWKSKTDGIGSIDDWLAPALLSKLTVTEGKGSNVLQINFDSSDPSFSAQIANGFARAYLSTQLRLRTDPAKSLSHLFEQQIQDARNALETAQKNLGDYQTAHGILDKTSVDTEALKLTQLSGALAGAEASAADAGARASGGSLAPEVQNSTVIQTLRSQIATQSAQVDQLRVTYGPNHPLRQQAEAQLAALKSKLASETGTAVQTARVASGAAYSQVGQMQGLVSSQKTQMLKQVDANNQLTLLQKDVDSARAAYDNLTQNLNVMKVQSALPQTNASLLDEATPPLLPSSPNFPLRIILGTLLGLMLGFATAIAQELMRPKTRSAGSVIRISGYPVVATLSMSRPSVVKLLSNGNVS